MAASKAVDPQALFGLESEYGFTYWPKRRGPVSRENGAVHLLESMCGNPYLWSGAGDSGIFLGNGARFYIDAGAHPEYCTPEVASPRDAVRHVAAGDRLLRRAADALVGRYLLTKCNVDLSGTGNTWGQHESYLCRRAMAEVAEGLVPHLVTRILFTGAGGFDNKRYGLHFVISPRAPHLGSVYASSSTTVRGIVHFREESHAAPPWHRLHLTYGEALCSQLATFLKVGTTSLVVLTLDYAPDAFTHLLPDDALSAAMAAARDIHCVRRYRVRDGRHLGAVEIQKEILGVVRKTAATHPFPSWTAEVCDRWLATLDALGRDPMSLAGALDWPTRLALYRDHLARAGVDEVLWRRCNLVHSWVHDNLAEERRADQEHQAAAEGGESERNKEKRAKKTRLAIERARIRMEDLELFDGLVPQLHEIDYRYGALGCESIFESLDASGVLAHRIVPEEEILLAMEQPPSDTRAKRRGAAVLELYDVRDHVRCDWSRVVDSMTERKLDLRDPLRHDVEWEPRPDTATQDAAEVLEELLGR